MIFTTRITAKSWNETIWTFTLWMKHVCILILSPKGLPCCVFTLESIQTIPFFGMQSKLQNRLSKQHKYVAILRVFYATIAKRKCILFMKYNWYEQGWSLRFWDHFHPRPGLAPGVSERDSVLVGQKIKRNRLHYFILILIKIDRSIKILLRFLLTFKFKNQQVI